MDDHVVKLFNTIHHTSLEISNAIIGVLFISVKCASIVSGIVLFLIINLFLSSMDVVKGG
jgi:hypothetical protein